MLTFLILETQEIRRAFWEEQIVALRKSLSYALWDLDTNPNYTVSEVNTAFTLTCYKAAKPRYLLNLVKEIEDGSSVFWVCFFSFRKGLLTFEKPDLFWLCKEK